MYEWNKLTHRWEISTCANAEAKLEGLYKKRYAHVSEKAYLKSVCENWNYFCAFSVTQQVRKLAVIIVSFTEGSTMFVELFLPKHFQKWCKAKP
jgi:hypothetical protein